MEVLKLKRLTNAGEDKGSRSNNGERTKRGDHWKQRP